jgi:molybdopterin synthase sulfur carrier subunit
LRRIAPKPIASIGNMMGFASAQPILRTADEYEEMSVKLLYFAWVRERIGKPDEVVEPPASVRTVADLVAWLTQRGDEYAHAFENPKVIRAAIDRSHVRPDAAIAGAREIAFFPPMTGG